MSTLSRLFRQKTKQAVGIDIGSGFLKVAEIDFSCSQPCLIAAGATSLPSGVVRDGSIDNVTMLANQLEQLMLSAGCRSKDVVFSVGGRSTFVREVLFPTMAPEELKEAISWDIERYVPYAPNTYYYDYSIVGNTESGLEMRVLLAAAPKEAVNSLAAIAKEAGLTPLAVDIESLAAARALGNPESALLVDVGDTISTITMLQGGCPVAARVVSVGGRSFTVEIMRSLGLTYQEAELLKMRQDGLLRPVNTEDLTEVSVNLAAAVASLAREIVQTSEYYKMQNKAAIIDKVVLTGGGAKLDKLVEHLELLTGMPVVLADPLLTVSSAATFDQQYIRRLAGQLTVPIGLSMRGAQL